MAELSPKLFKSENERLRADLAELRLRLEETEQALAAIRRGEAESIIVQGPNGPRIFSLEGADHAYRVLVEAMNEGAATLGEDGTVLYCNARLAQMLDVPLERIMGAEFRRFVPERSREPFEELVRQARGGDSRGELELRTEDGQALPIVLSLSAIQEDETRHRLCLVAADLRAQKRSEEIVAAERKEAACLRKKDEERLLLAALVENLPDLAWMALPDGHTDYYNRRWFEYTGTTLEEMQGWGWEKVHDPKTLPHVLARWKRSIATGEPFEMEFPLRGADGVFRWFLTRILPLRDARGGIVRWIGTNTNVDELRSLRDKLAASAERYRAAFEQAAVGMAEVSLDGRWLRTNARLCEIVGYSREELEQRTFQDVTYPDDLAKDLALLQELLDGARSSYSMEKRYVRKDGTIVWVFLTFALVRMASGEPDYLIKVVEDIGEAKRAAAERDELLHRERDARENAERASKFAELFVAMLGHDLRNPLSAIRTGSTFLAQSVKEERAQRVISRILNSSHRMARMIDQLLDFTCIRAGKGLPYQPAPMELHQVLFRVREELMSSDKTEKKLGVEIEGTTEGVWDGDRLAQVFSNLFANALEHSPAGALVRVNADGRASGHVEVTVHNPGVIPAELVPALFEPFRQGRPGKSRGLGLGLYITKEIVVMHGGTIDVLSSKSMRGTQFRVVLPRLAPRGKSTQGGS